MRTKDDITRSGNKGTLGITAGTKPPRALRVPALVSFHFMWYVGPGETMDQLCRCSKSVEQTTHDTTSTYTTHRQSTRHNVNLHDTSSTYTTQRQPTRYNVNLHDTSSIYTTQRQPTRHIVNLHDTTSTYTTQRQPTRHIVNLHDTTSNYTTHRQWVMDGW